MKGGNRTNMKEDNCTETDATTDEKLARICNESMSEITREYGTGHPIWYSIRSQIKTLHLHHHNAKKCSNCRDKQLG